MELSPERTHANIWLMLIGGGILIGGVVYLFISPMSPLRSSASQLNGSEEPASFLTRDGTVSEVNENSIVVTENETGSFTAKLTEETVIRNLNADGLFEIADRTQLSKDDLVSVYYAQEPEGIRVESVDILENK
ncbi:hypothetical protein HYW32_00740 [Candidatus Berkelbacteria bacterium]|nr:hypothetical protein [Candidatus Berkelbacteria bacterium]